MLVPFCRRSLALASSLVIAACGGDPEAAPAPEPEPWPEPVCIDEPYVEPVWLDVVDETFPYGPYLMHTTTDSAVVMWRTDEPCQGEVHYGGSATDLSQRVGSDQPSVTHELELTGLAPGAHVFYQAAACGLETEVLDFYAAPAPGSPLRLTVWGDSQDHPAQATATVDAMVSRRPLLDLHVGDTVGDGSVDEQWGEQLFEPLRPLGHHVPTYIAIGNHEANDPQFFEVVSYPPSVPGEPGAESTYAFAFGNAFFLVVDTNQLFHDVDLGGGEVLETPLSSFIKSALASDAARTARWRFALGHEPAITESWSPGACGAYDGNLHVRDWLFPLLERHRFHAYFAGHTHAYERGTLDGVVHVITGGGGGGLDEWCEDLPEVDVAEPTHHYLAVDLDCAAATISAYRTDDDELLDRVVIE